MSSNYKQCTRCVLDTTVKDIKFDADGVCHYCHEYDDLASKTVLRPKSVIDAELKATIEKIKNKGKKNKYDCIIGLSGGVDSTYLCLLAKRLGLRPLVVHFDNGWNSELAVKNIESVITKLGFDLFTYVINWNEFKDLQMAYLKASVVDIEVPTDSLISATLFKIARKKGIKYILSGTNIVTEGIVPNGWNYQDKTDLTNLTNIHNKYGKVKLRDFPKFGLFQRYIYLNFFRIESVPILNLIGYNKTKVKEEITQELNWRDYGGKHYESIFTRFYQGYILVQKFNIDKRRMHLATLICSGQISRQEALHELSQPGYDLQMLSSDKEFVLKKFDISAAEFDAIMQTPPVEHAVFGTQWDPQYFKKYFYFTLLMKPILWLYNKLIPR